MKLESVDKILNISINFNDLLKTVSALQRIINHFDGDSDEMINDLQNLKDFHGQLDKILIDMRDY
ncbi:hypothetical protein LCGC14_1698560 [marine sediment metagenome]|uniref:Uncharacterized protein n=1 Tax=marine sediment metagenome TaxID=412755 RepID=A0A0F9HIE7_9ZZZZ